VESGVVDQDVAAAKLLVDLLGDGRDGRRLHEIARLHDDLAAGLADGRCRLLQRLLAPPRQHDSGIFLGERNRRRLTNTRAGTGHPGDLARQRSHRCLLATNTTVNPERGDAPPPFTTSPASGEGLGSRAPPSGLATTPRPDRPLYLQHLAGAVVDQ